ncbi:MAG: hypothetical protein ACRCUY_08415 [Thermoguttaceae bacterium]
MLKQFSSFALFGSAFLVLSLFLGCSKTPQKPASNQSASETQKSQVTDKQSNDKMVIPLEPSTEPASNTDNKDANQTNKIEIKQDVPSEKPATPTAEKVESPKDGAFLLPSPASLSSSISGKVASEAVSLPPVNDLVAQVDEYVSKLDETINKDLDGTSNYKNDSDAVVRDANALALVALGIGLSESDSQYKKAAPGIFKAAINLAGAETYENAKKACAVLQESLKSEGDAGDLSWKQGAANQKVHLKPLMLAVPNLDATLKRLTNTEKKLTSSMKKPERLYGTTAALAVIAQGSMANVAETIKPDAAAEWEIECKRFRDAAIKTNTALHDFADGKIEYAAFESIYEGFSKTCDECHAIFQPSAGK